MTMITESAELADFCQRQAKAEYITVDTEFMRDSTYWPKLCLAQVGGPEESVAIDTLAPGIDLAPLLDLMANRKILKVFHSARQDLEIFFLIMDALPVPIFDTQVAAMVCGFGDSVGYDKLVRKLTGKHIDKSRRFADWSRRPLKDSQIDYAISDVVHLRPVYEKLRRQLEKRERTAWLDEEMAVLRALAAWRETEAQRRDVPRNRVLREEQLFDIAAHHPSSTEELSHTRGMGRDAARGRIGQAILVALAEGMAVPEEDCPAPPPQRDQPAGLGPLVDLLKVVLKLQCERHDVAQKLVASVADLEQIAADDNAEVRAMSGWRREIFGEDALALKQGRLGLGMAGKKLVMVPLAPSGPAEKASKT